MHTLHEHHELRWVADSSHARRRKSLEALRRRARKARVDAGVWTRGTDHSPAGLIAV
jgi:hypothetical protein